MNLKLKYPIQDGWYHLSVTLKKGASITQSEMLNLLRGCVNPTTAEVAYFNHGKATARIIARNKIFNFKTSTHMKKKSDITHCAILIKKGRGTNKTKEWKIVTVEEYDNTYAEQENIDLGHQGSLEDCELFIAV